MVLASEELGPAKRTGEKSGLQAILSLQYELKRLELIADKVIGKEPLSRGTRDSHFVEAWLYAVSGYDPDHPEKERNPHKIPFKTSLNFALRMRQLSPHEEGKHIAVVQALLNPQPGNITLLGSPYDNPPEGFLSGLLNRARGKKPEGNG